MFIWIAMFSSSLEILFTWQLPTLAYMPTILLNKQTKNALLKSNKNHITNILLNIILVFFCSSYSTMSILDFFKFIRNVCYWKMKLFSYKICQKCIFFYVLLNFEKIIWTVHSFFSFVLFFISDSFCNFNINVYSHANYVFQNFKKSVCCILTTEENSLIFY